MSSGKRNMILFDVIYSFIILILLIELFMSGSVIIGSDAAVLTLSVAAAMIIVLIYLKEKQYFKTRLR